MKSLADAIKDIQATGTNVFKQSGSQRAELLGQLYDFYILDKRKNDWKNYISWLKRNKIKHSKEQVSIFKKTEFYKNTITIKSFASFWLGFLKTEDLFYLVSIAKDKLNRGESFNRWLFWALKPPKDVV